MLCSFVYALWFGTALPNMATARYPKAPTSSGCPAYLPGRSAGRTEDSCRQPSQQQAGSLDDYHRELREYPTVILQKKSVGNL